MNLKEAELTDLLDELNRRILKPQPEVEAGQYWRLGVWIVRVSTIENDSVGYEYIGQHEAKGRYWYDRDDFINECTLLTDTEVEQALIEEAGRRGYSHATHVKSILSNKERVEIVNAFRYKALEDKLWAGLSVIYCMGEWAQIIEDGWEVKERYNPAKYTVECGDRVIEDTTRSSGLKRGEATAIAKALNDL